MTVANPVVLFPTHRKTLDDNETLALEAADEHLCDYDWVTVGVQRFIGHGARHLDVPDYYAEAGWRGYNTLLCARGLYEALRPYTHVLVYQLDAIVFRDDLEHFCDLPFDYIGAPFYDPDPAAGRPPGGNGGFSLRYIPALVAALQGLARWPTPESYYRHVGTNEDVFWSSRAQEGVIRGAPVDVQAAFSWETDPAWWWLQADGHRKGAAALPMGAHGWERHSPEFWDNLGGVRALAGLEGLPASEAQA